MEHSTEDYWISTADLLSTFVAVLIMILVTFDTTPSEQIKAMNALKEQLKANITNNNGEEAVEVISDGSSITMVLKAKAFARDSYALTEGMKNFLSHNSGLIQDYIKNYEVLVRIEGHADHGKIGENKTIKIDKLEYKYDNVLLSSLRALAAKEQLTSTWDIQCREKVCILGYGYNKPKFQNSEDYKNRRVEITFVPNIYK